MPKGDRTGLAVAGPKSGRGAGLCSGFSMPGFTHSQRAGGSGRTRQFRHRRDSSGSSAGYRRRRNRCFAPDQSGPMHTGRYPGQPQFFRPGSEKESLKERRRIIQTELNEINTRLETI